MTDNAWWHWTDARFPGVEIRNCGGSTFNIYENGVEVECFTHYSPSKRNAEPPTHRERRQIACEHFNDMAAMKQNDTEGEERRRDARLKYLAECSGELIKPYSPQDT